ncbi:MAG: hypothetical protein WD603_01645 [Patescibacteria group bacterium]
MEESVTRRIIRSAQVCFTVTLLLNLWVRLFAWKFGSADRKAARRTATVAAREAGGRKAVVRLRMRQTFRRPVLITLAFIPFTIIGNLLDDLDDGTDRQPSGDWGRSEAAPSGSNGSFRPIHHQV